MAHSPSTTSSLRTRVGAIRVLGAAVFLVAVARPALADEEVAPTYAVQNRAFHLRHEFNLGFGVLPINAFTKGLTLGGGYTFHFNQLLAWEIVQFHYSFAFDTNLTKQLEQNYNVQPTQISSLNYFATSNFVFKPLYGKLALTNRWVAHLEVFFAAGVGAGMFTNPMVVRPGFDAGGGFRFYLNDLFSLRLDVRDYTFFTGGTSTSSELFIGLAAAVTFGGGAQ